MDPIRDHSIELRPGMSADELLEALGRNGVTLRLVRDGKVVAFLQRVDEKQALERQHHAVRALFEELEAMAAEPEPDDGLTGSVDHDEILYGE